MIQFFKILSLLIIEIYIISKPKILKKNKIERNNILSFTESISENQISYSNFRDTSSNNEEKYLINSPSTLSKSKSK